jgi:hypothetical protein
LSWYSPVYCLDISFFFIRPDSLFLYHGDGFYDRLSTLSNCVQSPISRLIAFCLLQVRSLRVDSFGIMSPGKKKPTIGPVFLTVIWWVSYRAPSCTQTKGLRGLTASSVSIRICFIICLNMIPYIKQRNTLYVKKKNVSITQLCLF